jgi:hypothetical protein
MMKREESNMRVGATPRQQKQKYAVIVDHPGQILVAKISRNVI